MRDRTGFRLRLLLGLPQALRLWLRCTIGRGGRFWETRRSQSRPSSASGVMPDFDYHRTAHDSVALSRCCLCISRLTHAVVPVLYPLNSAGGVGELRGNGALADDTCDRNQR